MAAARSTELLLTQAVDDQVIKYQGTIDYYTRVVDRVGPDTAADVVRLFLTEGDFHGFCIAPGPGISTAGGIIALMDWIENGRAPEEIIAERFDPGVRQVIAPRPAYPFPAVPQYNGEGDPAAASSHHAHR